MPDSLSAAKQCKTALEISEWKQHHIQKILSLKVIGEEGVDDQPNKTLVVRDSDHLDAGYKLKKNFEFPKTLDYDAYVVGFTHDGSNWGLNIIMSNGAKSSLPMPAGWKDTRTVEQPKTVSLWFNYFNGHSHLNGVQYHSSEAKLILEAGNCFG